MSPNVVIAWQAAAFFGPIIVTLFICWVGWLSGNKTNLNSFCTFATGVEMIRFEFLPDPIAQALVPGFAIATLLSNTILTERVK
jgi:hypothetical protein